MKTGWEVKKLGDVCDVIGGGTPSKSNTKYYDGDILWATVRDMKFITIEETEHKITTEAVKNSSTNIIPKGNVIIATRVGLGKVCLLKYDTAINQDLRGIIPKSGSNLLIDYLFHWFKSISQIIVKEGTGATVQGVKLPFIKSLAFPLPPVSEQERIVDILDETFASICKAKNNAEKNLKNAQELFKSYLHAIFTNKGVNWEDKRLGEVYDVRDGTHDSPKYQVDGFALVTSKNLKRDTLVLNNIKYISENDYKKINERSKVNKGDILFAMIGTIGNPVVIKDEPNFAIKNVALFKVPSSQNSYFLKYFLDSKKTIDLMKKDAKGTTQKFVGLGYLRDFRITLPSFSEQQRIVSKLDALSTETKKLEAIYQKKLTNLEELKKSILQKAFNGEL